jgi:hypothetical protein
MRQSTVIALLFAFVTSCSTLGEPIPSYSGRAQGSKAQDEEQCEQNATGADVIKRRLSYISCMIAKGWRVYVPVTSKSIRGVANLTVVATRDQSQDQVFADLSSCGEKLDLVVGGPTIGATQPSPPTLTGVGAGIVGQVIVAAVASRLVEPFAACLAERGYQAARWDGS